MYEYKFTRVSIYLSIIDSSNLSFFSLFISFQYIV